MRKRWYCLVSFAVCSALGHNVRKLDNLGCKKAPCRVVSKVKDRWTFFPFFLPNANSPGLVDSKNNHENSVADKIAANRFG